MSQLGIAGKARYNGIPNPTITFTGRSGTSRVLEIFTTFKKAVMGDVADSVDNDGERQSSKTRNKRIQLTFSAKPVGASAADALAIAADLPDVNTLATIACASDPQAATPAGGSSVIDSADADYTPDGEAVVNFTVTNWIGKVFVVLN